MGGKPGRKGSESESFSLPFCPLFGMVFDLSLGVQWGSPKHKKNRHFRQPSGTGKQIS
jgi:hypothetical protein